MSEILIDTPRLQMREFCREDAKAVMAFNSSPEILKYIPGDAILKSEKEALKIIEKIWLKEYKQYGYARYALIHKADDKVIGFCGFKFEPEWGYPDVGYRIMPKYWGQGLVSEAVEALLKYGTEVLGLEKLVAGAAVDNIASNKILQKFGFQKKKIIDVCGMPHHYYENWS